MPRQQRKAKPKPKPDRYPCINDWLEFVILVVASFGVGGAIFALIYLMHEAGAI